MASLSGKCCYLSMFGMAFILQPSIMFAGSERIAWTHPTDLTVREGESAEFRCALRIRKPYESLDLVWTNGFTPYETGDHNTLLIMSERNYSMGTIISKVVIQNSSRYSDVAYMCCAKIRYLDGTVDTLFSRFGRLDVQYFLSANDMVCIGPTEIGLREQEVFDVECEAPKANPEVRLNFEVIDGSGPSRIISTTYKDEGGKHSLHAELVAGRHIHNKTLSCIATSSAYPEEKVNCSIGPLKVFHVPYVEVKHPEQSS